MGPYGRELQNFPIPPLALSEQYRNGQFFKLYFFQGVAELEALAAAKQTTRVLWDADVVAAFPLLAEGGIYKIDSSMRFVQIWKEVPHTMVVGVLDAIRSRLLDFTIQIGQEEPSTEDERPITDPRRVEHIVTVLNNTIYAQNANIAIGSRDVTQTQTLPEPFDRDGLMDYLRKKGLNDDMIDELQDALDEDAKEENEAGEDDKPKQPGHRVLSWLKKVSTAATTQVGSPVATAVITEDQTFAEKVHADLQSKGVSCWFAPHDLKTGDKLRTQIYEAIQKNDKLLLILSEYAVKNDWVEREVELAFERERQPPETLVLFPIRLDDAVIQTRTAWAGDIRRLRFIGDFRQWRDDAAYQRALQRLLRDLQA